MARDLVDSDYYTSHGGQIPVKWTAPEVNIYLHFIHITTYLLNCRLCTIRSTPQPVMCGVLVVSCTRYGVSDTNHLKTTRMLRYITTDNMPLVCVVLVLFYRLCVW